MERKIIIQTHSRHKHKVKYYFGCYDPLHYPLLNPRGKSWWTQKIKKKIQGLEVELMVEVHTVSTRGVVSVIEIKDRDKSKQNTIYLIYIYTYKIILSIIN